MAKRRSTSDAGSRSKRHRRSSEELIADLQRKIEEVRRRQETHKLKQSVAVRSALAALRSLDKGLTASSSEEDAELQQALTASRKALAGLLESRGIELAKRQRRTKGRRGN
jgi:hypothetical protein